MNPLTAIDGAFSMHEAKRELDDLLTLLVERGGSDLHITAGIAPCFRINGELRPLEGRDRLLPVDTETLIRTTDRFLMFYIRTADRLQRTAPWLESLDGGLDYLRSVLVDDVLGIGAELDAAMASHVDNYRDEWADVLADPDRLSRFVSFVNAPDVSDDELQFVEERGQRRPLLPVVS